MPNGKNKRRWGFVLGLTGGFGSGKSTALALFKKKGAFTLDADAIVHGLLNKDRRVRSSIKRKFKGVFAPSGELDRKKLAGMVFTSAARKKALERILHPRVREIIWSELNKKSGKAAVLDIPLLYESGWEAKLDGVVVVNASLKNRLTRLEKKGFAAADARRRIKAQMSLSEKARRADYVVENDGPVKKMKKQIDEIWASIT